MDRYDPGQADEGRAMDTTSYQQGELIGTLFLIIGGYVLYGFGRQVRQDTRKRRGNRRWGAGLVMMALGGLTVVSGFFA